MGSRYICSQYEFMEKSIYSDLSQILQEELVKMRKNAGLTQRQLAKELHREHNLVARLELGERRIDLIEFFRICLVCQVSPSKTAERIMIRFSKFIKDDAQ